MVLSTAWLRPALSARILFAITYAGVVLLGGVTSSSWREFGWWMPAMTLILVSIVVQDMGMGVLRDPDKLVIRGGFSERHVPRSRVVGLEFTTSLTIVVRGGRSYTTNLVQTNLRPSPERFAALGRELGPVGREPLPVLIEEDLKKMGGPGSPDFDPEVLHQERPRFYRPEWWQWVLYAIFLGSCILGGVNG